MNSCIQVPLLLLFLGKRVGLCRLLTQTNQEVSGRLTRVVYTSAIATSLFRHCPYRLDLKGHSAPHSPAVLALWSLTAPPTSQLLMEAMESSSGTMACFCSMGINPVSLLPLHLIFAQHLFKQLIYCINTPLFKVPKIISVFLSESRALFQQTPRKWITFKKNLNDVT